MMRNFIKRCFVIIAIVAISLLSACNKQNSSFDRNECIIEFYFYSDSDRLYGQIFGKYGDRNLSKIIIYEEDILGKNDDIIKYLQKSISEITNEEVTHIIKYQYSFNKNYIDPSFDVTGYYSTKDRAYSYMLKVTPTNSNIFEAIRKDLKDSYIKINMAESLYYADEVDWDAGTVEWCEEKASTTSKSIKEKIIQYFKLWCCIEPQEIIIYKPWTGIGEDYEVYIEFDNQWFKAVIPINLSPLDEKEKKEVEEFTNIIHTEFLQSEYYAELLRKYGD